MKLDQVSATAERLSLCYLEAEFLPETVVLVDGGELKVRYAAVLADRRQRLRYAPAG